jgi:hypothetical protein
MLSFFIVFNLQVAVNNTKPVSFAMETEECVLCALLSSYKICRNVVNKKEGTEGSMSISDTVTASKQIWSFSPDFCESPHKISSKSVLWESAVRTHGQR